MSAPAIDVTEANLGDRVLIDAGDRAGATTRASWARVERLDPDRPQLALVRYEDAGNTVWVRRRRIRASYRPRAGR